MTQKELFERKIILLQDEIQFLQDAISTMTHESTLNEREIFFADTTDETGQD